MNGARMAKCIARQTAQILPVAGFGTGRLASTGPDFLLLN